MASPAPYSRARRLFSAFFSTTPRAQAPALEPALAPAPGQNAADGEVGAKPHAGRNRRKGIGKILRVISEERDPDKLVSQFITASTLSRNFRDNRRVYEVAVSRLASYGRRDAAAALLDSQKPFIEACGEGFAVRLVRLYGRAYMPSHAAATFPQSTRTWPLGRPRCYPAHGEVRSYPDVMSFNSLLNGFYNNGRFDDAEKVWQMMKERNVEPNTKSYNAKLRGLVAEGRLEDAIAVFQTMQKDGPKPDSVSFNELIRGYYKEGRLDEAKKCRVDDFEFGKARHVIGFPGENLTVAQALTARKWMRALRSDC
ncbi:hypothetical protein C2845_PM07G26890 [Panicum miliaceum]|uniref:Pentatricopeptide repeat-containing protein n=1 Tax=Panicum miliaceum TaxID=4540 RepID=A0A3L6SIB6_PANMI|nr:hypothetical protein C2845_PM07G26890 [Panicum miliaceum]